MRAHRSLPSPAWAGPPGPLLADGGHEHGLDRVHPIFGLIEDDRLRGLKHLIGHFELRQTGRLHSYDVDVEFRNGTARLTGTVADSAQRDELVRVAQGVAGVKPATP